MEKKTIVLSSASFFLFWPVIVLAVIVPSAPSGSLTIPLIINTALNFIWPLFIGFAVVMFIIAGFQFLAAHGDPEGVGKAKKALLWGIIGIIVAVLAFTIPFFIQSFIINPPAPPLPPPPIDCRPAGSACATLPNACCGSCQQVGTTPGSPVRLWICVGP